VPATQKNYRRRRSSNARRHRRRNGQFVSRHNVQRDNVRRDNRRRRNPQSWATNRRHRPRTTANRRHYRRRNAGPKIVVYKTNRRPGRRGRNPISTTLFDQPLFGKNSLEVITGAFGGLILAKFIPTLFPTSITGGIASSSIGRVVISGIAAVVGAWAVSKISGPAGQGALLGGMVQTLSIALNTFLPSAYTSVSQYATLGDLTPAGYPVPMNPILAGRTPVAALPAPSSPMVSGGGGQVRMTPGQSGLGRPYGAAY